MIAMLRTNGPHRPISMCFFGEGGVGLQAQGNAHPGESIGYCHVPGHIVMVGPDDVAARCKLIHLQHHMLLTAGCLGDFPLCRLPSN